MLTMEQIHLDKKVLGRKFHYPVHLLVFALTVFGCAFSAPAVACLCSCSFFSGQGKNPTAPEFTLAEYDQIFSGLIISTERIDEPVAAAAVSGEKIVEDPGSWTRSKVLVLRIWRGAPATVTEIWTPVVTDCDSPPIAGSYFVALVRSEQGRSVASNSICDCAQKVAATEGRGAFAITGIVITMAAIGAAAIVLLSFVRLIRRYRSA